MRFLFLFCAILWFSAAVGGVFYLMRYESTTAVRVSYPATLPAESSMEPDGERPTLIFFAHPKCPCTRSSLRELSRLITNVNGRVQAYVVFIQPEDEDELWTQTDLRTSAEAIPNVRVLIDRGERETHIFNAQTSGLVLLYDRKGNLRFNGGVTASRGLEGDNGGSRAIFEIVTQEVEKTAETSVFGCPLLNKDCPGGPTQYAQQ